ncbi:MAG: hypothetical protein ACR2MB_16160 [Acidimicrobiales bacterium]
MAATRTEPLRPGVSSFDRIDALVANPELYALADAVPLADPSAGGRPRQYPVFMWLLFDALISVYGSARRVETELAHPIVWAHLRGLVRDQFPDDPERWLPAQPIRRHHYLHGRTAWLTQPEVLERLSALHRKWAADQARQIGLLDEHGSGSWTHPHLSRMIHADGKVITPLFRSHPGDTKLDKETGELRPLRAEHDAALHFEGTGETAWGTKWVLVACRSEEVHGRIILDVKWVPQPGSEAGIAVDSFADLAPLCPGAQGVVYDTALRGVHHQQLLRDFGWLSVNKVAAKVADTKGKARRGQGRRVEKSTHVEDRTITDASGNEQAISLFAHGGAIGISVLTDTGNRTFVELPRIRTHRNTDKAGFRWYNEYRLPEHLGGGTISVRLHGNDEDAKRRFNRTENVRPIPQTDPDFKALYRRRNDAESINRALDDTMWLRRAHSIGHKRQHLNLLTHALGVNSLAIWRRRRSQIDPPLPLAA